MYKTDKINTQKTASVGPSQHSATELLREFVLYEVVILHKVCYLPSKV